MRRKYDLYQKAVELRKNGWSYKELIRDLGVAKSTLSVWLRGVRLNDDAVRRLLSLQKVGRAKSVLSIKNFIVQRDRVIRENVIEKLQSTRYDTSVLGLLCSMLYWAEGSKSANAMCFTNSDPLMVRAYVKLFKSAFPAINLGSTPGCIYISTMIKKN